VFQLRIRDVPFHTANGNRLIHPLPTADFLTGPGTDPAQDAGEGGLFPDKPGRFSDLSFPDQGQKALNVNIRRTGVLAGRLTVSTVI
jgi:hypothetical protein